MAGFIGGASDAPATGRNRSLLWRTTFHFRQPDLCNFFAPVNGSGWYWIAMQQDQLDGLIAFVAVSQEKGFSAAAVRLGVSPSAVSQSIKQLEERLGLALFNRTTRSVGLTEAGQRYLDRILPAISELAAASEELVDSMEHPKGLLRLNVPRSAYMIVLQPILKEFLRRNPDVNLEIIVENSLVDVVRQGFDAGVRFGDLVEKDMVAIRIGPPLVAHVVAAPGYLETFGRPHHPRDLFKHSCIGFRHLTSGQVERWEFAKANEKMDLAVTGRLIVNDSAALVQAALDGIGIAYMINGYIEKYLAEGRLVRLLEDWSPPLAGLHLYYPDRKRVPPKLRALIEFLRNATDLSHDLSAFLK